MISQYKRDLSPLYIKLSSDVIIHKLTEHPKFKSAHCLCIYNALFDEPQTLDFIKKWCKHKEIYLPIIRNEDIVLSRVTNTTKLKKGRFNILEPDTENILHDLSQIQLIIVPGIAFDTKCNRLGRGKGYYDRLLSRSEFANVYKIGMCFDFQKFETLPIHSHDIKMDEVL